MFSKSAHDRTKRRQLRRRKSGEEMTISPSYINFYSQRTDWPEAIFYHVFFELLDIDNDTSRRGTIHLQV